MKPEELTNQVLEDLTTVQCFFQREDMDFRVLMNPADLTWLTGGKTVGVKLWAKEVVPVESVTPGRPLVVAVASQEKQ